MVRDVIGGGRERWQRPHSVPDGWRHPSQRYGEASVERYRRVLASSPVVESYPPVRHPRSSAALDAGESVVSSLARRRAQHASTVRLSGAFGCRHGQGHAQASSFVCHLPVSSQPDEVSPPLRSLHTRCTVGLPVWDGQPAKTAVVSFLAGEAKDFTH
jgi:hypothetical protein